LFRDFISSSLKYRNDNGASS